MTSELRGIIGLLAERRPTVTVIGDVILDEWWRGHSDRMTREAPAPVVDVTERIQSLGGAANSEPVPVGQAVSGAAHWLQKRAPGTASVPHALQ